MPVTLINTFKVPPEEEQEFLKRWSETTAVYARTSGFLETHMHRNTGVGNPTFNYINIAIWASGEAFLQAHKDYVRVRKAYRVLSSIQPFMRRSS